MTQATKCLLIGSIEPYSGKSGTVLGMAYQLQQKGFRVAYGKPLGTCLNQTNTIIQDEDVEFITQVLSLPPSQVLSPLVYLDSATIQKRLQGQDNQDYTQVLPPHFGHVEGDILLLEGAGTLWEGNLFNLSLGQIAKTLETPILLVTRYNSPLVVDSLLQAKQVLDSRLLGVVINDIPLDQLEDIQFLIKPFLEKQGIPVLGTLPRSSLLRSVSVREIAHQLQADILCRADRLDLMVESLAIGAMNVNAALEYFRRGRNMAVVTGGDRTDLQIAALETSTNCLILTGHIQPNPLILSRAEDLEVPILSVNLDTLTTVEIVDQTFGKVRLQEEIKVKCIQQMMEAHFDINGLIDKIGLKLSN